MKSVTLEIPIHLLPRMKAHLVLLQSQEIDIERYLNTEYSVSCDSCENHAEINGVSKEEAHRKLVDKGWRRVFLEDRSQLACPFCADRLMEGGEL